MPDAANTRWFSALKVLSGSGELGQGKMSIIRMIYLIDVDGTLVLVVGSAFTKDIAEQARAPINAVITQVWGHPMSMEVTTNTSSKASRAPMPSVAPEPVNPTIVAPAPASSPSPFIPSQSSGPFTVPTTPAASTVPTYGEWLAEPLPYSAATPSPMPHSQVLVASAPSTMSNSPPGRSGLPGTYSPRGTGPQNPTGLLTPTAVHDIPQLNPRYTFNAYVIDSPSRFTCATALVVTEALAHAYNSLSIYGGFGLGKAHLLHAIGHYAQTLNSGTRVKYVNPEVFVFNFIACARDGDQDNGHMEGFKRRCREVDILLVDDTQSLQGRESTLEEFFHTSNSLHSLDKQMVPTSDQPPKTLGGLNERLHSCFEWGLLIDAQSPDLETRITTLSRKGTAEDLGLSFDVLEYIASRIAIDIHEPEGALTRVTAFTPLNKQPVDQTLAEMVLKNIVSGPEGREITTSLVMAQTVDYFGTTVDDLCLVNRSHTMVLVRHIAMYLCRGLTDFPLPKIGREFGECDHTTIISADKKIRTLMARRRSTFSQVTELTNCIRWIVQSPA